MDVVATAAVRRAPRFRSSQPSPLVGVSDAAWKRFVDALDVQAIKAVSPSEGLGAYDLRPRRLVELGYARRLHRTRTPAGRQVYTCEFVPPWTRDRFLGDAMAQYAALCRSMVLYAQDLASGKLVRPEGLSLAGALAILHRGGRGALADWPALFDDTRALYEAAQGAF